ncbi:MAG: terminase small subunit [Acidobacteria bacterium]|nr:MAG: terminase small subunit [Acidobacteriota bacterium]
MGLTARQKRFIAEYLINPNATKAAIAAGYSKKTAEVAGSRLLRNVKVSQALAKKSNALYADLEISARKVLQGIAQLAYFDPRKLFDEDGRLKPITELNDVTAMAVYGIDVQSLYSHFGKGQAQEIGTISKIKLADRGLNLERLGRHLKLFTDRVEVTDLAGILARLKAGRERAAKS